MTNYLALLNSFSFLLVAITSFATFLLCYFKKICRVGQILGIVSFVNLFMFFFTIFWATGTFFISAYVYLFVHAVFIITTAFLIMLISYKLTNNFNYFFLLLLLMPVFFMLQFGIENFYIFSMLLSSLFMVFLFFNLMRFTGFHLKKLGIFGIFYCYIMILMLVYSYGKLLNFFWFLPNLVMFLVFYYFNLEIKSCGKILSSQEGQKSKSGFFHIFAQSVKFLVFLISITLFIMFSATALHEIGHSIAAYSYGCTNIKAIIFETKEWPHTELRCNSESTNTTVILLAGTLFVLLVSLIFFLINTDFTRDISFLLSGFALLSSYGDLDALFLPNWFLMSVFVVSLLLILLGMIKLSFSYKQLMESDLFCFSKKEEPVKSLKN